MFASASSHFFVITSVTSISKRLGQRLSCMQLHCIAWLADANSDVRWQASHMLTQFGAAAVPEMIAALNHRIPEVRRLLIAALGRVGTEAHSAVPSLLVALHDVNADVRSVAADCLGRFGVVSRPMVHALMQSLSESIATSPLDNKSPV